MSTVRVAVRALLQRSPAFAQLPADQRRELARDMIHVASRLSDPARLVAAQFRAPLLAGVRAERSGLASIEQMRAFAELLRQASDFVDHFVKDRLDDRAARDWLAESFR